MTEGLNIPQLGAQDPELKNSLVFEENDEESLTMKQEVPGTPVCYFNAISYRHGESVCSGTAVLQCNYGIWVRVSGADPDNP